MLIISFTYIHNLEDDNVQVAHEYEMEMLQEG